jgi:RNA-directed DNA polymerase
VNAETANPTIEKVQQLQRKLYLSAKRNHQRKYHALYDKLTRKDILSEAWKRVLASGGAGGIDGISLQDIEAYGVEKLLDEIRRDLQDGTYRPQPVRRVYIPKADGKKRPLGIPIIRDRIVQMAVKLVMEPVFEADFKDSSYGFRPKRNAHQALEAVRHACNRRGWWVVEADIQGYFDHINHDKLMQLVQMRISDRRILKLIRQWLQAGVMVEGTREETRLGSPQGGVISPLLANIYLHYLDVVWEKNGQGLGKLIRYADDFVIVCRSGPKAEHALKLVRAVMERMELTLHPEKTKVVNLRDGREGFDFLGMRHQNRKGHGETGQYHSLYQYPSSKAMRKMRERVSAELGHRAALQQDLREMVEKLNPKIRGWRNYYRTKTSRHWLAKIDWHILQRFTIWYNKKHQRRAHFGRMSIVLGQLNELGLEKMVG